ncbi:hypothetical protein C0J52_19729 [Blattella germanica]|nr:hypothetical protein C0J52_19729 [Blattella germanica]
MNFIIHKNTDLRIFPKDHNKRNSNALFKKPGEKISEEGRNYLNELKNVSESEAPPVTIEDRATNYMQKNHYVNSTWRIQLSFNISEDIND